MGYAFYVPFNRTLGQKTYIATVLALTFAAMAGADPCNKYYKCPYEVTGDTRALPWVMQDIITDRRLAWREQDVNGNQAVVCVRGGRDMSVFTNSGCVEITREEAAELLSEPLYVPYSDGGELKFRDGQEGRALETMEPHPQALEMLEAVR